MVHTVKNVPDVVKSYVQDIQILLDQQQEIMNIWLETNTQLQQVCNQFLYLVTSHSQECDK